jgi:hypothetical protein
VGDTSSNDPTDFGKDVVESPYGIKAAARKASIFQGWGGSKDSSTR